MTTFIKWPMISEGDSTGFFEKGANPIEFGRLSGRLFVGQGADFEGQVRGNNSNLGSWVHTEDEVSVLGSDFYNYNSRIDGTVTATTSDLKYIRDLT